MNVATPYGRSGLRNARKRVHEADRGEIGDVFAREAFSLGRLVAGEQLSGAEARATVEELGAEAGLTPAQIARTIRESYELGLLRPRIPGPQHSGAANGRKSPSAAARDILHSIGVVPPGATAENGPRELETECWPTFRDGAEKELPQLVEGIWPVSAMGFVAAAPKRGKTWLALLLALSVALGSDFLGRFRVPKRWPVLYVALEGTRTGLRARIGALARGMGVDPDGDALDDLHIVYKPRGINLSDEVWASALINAAREIGAGLVIVDVLRRAATVAEDVKGAGDFAALLRNLAELEAEGRALAFLHHFTKSSESTKGRPTAERMAGSGALYGALDVGLFITSSDGARSMQVEIEARDIRAPKPFRVELRGDATGPNGGWSYVDTVQATVDTTEVPSDVDVMVDQLVQLREAEPDITRIDAAARLGTTRNATVFQSAWAVAEERVRGVCASGGKATHARTHTSGRDVGTGRGAT